MILVLGIGNLIMSDDGAGVRTVRLLQEQYAFPPSVEVLDGGTLGLDLLPRLERVGKLLLIDAVETGEEPGTVVRLSGDEIPLALETKVSPHQMGLKDLLTVASLQGIEIPETILLGIQPQSLELGTELSPPVAQNLPALAAMAAGELRRWGVPPARR